ncbi:MAG: DNRLRE domain-containing protein [Segetibacter sp.]
MNKNYYAFSKPHALSFIVKSCFTGFFVCFAYAAVFAQSSITLLPVADAYVRNGSYATTNFGSSTSLVVKSATESGFVRASYLKFSLSTVSNVSSAKLRLYGSNADNTARVSFSCYGVNNDSWTESGITFNNTPVALTTPLASASVTNVAQYCELDVTDYVKAQIGSDKIVSFSLKDPA